MHENLHLYKHIHVIYVNYICACERAFLCNIYIYMYALYLYVCIYVCVFYIYIFIYLSREIHMCIWYFEGVCVLCRLSQRSHMPIT